MNKWTTATKALFDRGYGLFVFTRKSAAIKFAQNISDKIFIAEAEDPLEELPADQIFIPVPINFNWPPSTKVYRRVKLIKELKYQNVQIIKRIP